jgi:glycosyltransferase involved in cell wall biosynthesis
MTPFISIIIPCRNEIAFIDRCLDSVLASDLPIGSYELLIVDGMSDDGTRDVVRSRAAGSSAIRLVDNPARIVPTAMNLGIAAAKGATIVRLDAHCEYPANYVSALVRWLDESGADNVGGLCRTRPANDTAVAHAIAIGVSHPFGVGNSYFRIGVTEPRWVDTVPFGCYRRAVFERIGLFDEDLVRNQDDEFNARLVNAGGRILLVPDVVSDYFARGTLRHLWRMYFEYGLFKPLVARKLGRVMTVRQLVPALFVAGLVFGGLGAWLLPMLRLPFALVLAAYAGADVWFALRAARTERVACRAWLLLVFPLLHVAYGVGFLMGLGRFVLRTPRVDARTRALTPSR